MEKQSAINSVLVTAYAKAPQGSAMHELYKHAGIVLEIDPNTNCIVNAEVTFLTDLAKDFFRRLVVGYNLTNGIDNLVERIHEHYFAPSTKSVVVGLMGAYKRYSERKNQ